MSSLKMGGEGGDFWGLCLTADVGLSCWEETERRFKQRFSVIHLTASEQTPGWGRKQTPAREYLSIVKITLTIDSRGRKKQPFQ